MAMKASYFVGKGSFEVRQAPELHPGAGEVVVRNKFCGVCGTDVHIFHGEPGSADVNPPVVLGHEYSGEIVEVGEGVTDLQVGDHVTVDPNIYCGKCEHCRNGKKQLCESMEAIGVTRDGGFAQYSQIPASQACQKLNSPLPISAPSPAISTVPGRIKPTSASDSRKATNTTAINEYTVDWVIKCSSNACIMCLSNGRSRDSANPMLLRQAVNCLIRYQL